jgi:hypothetical protein
MALTRFASTRLSNSRPTLTSRADNAKRITNVRGNSANIANPTILLPYYTITAPPGGVAEGFATAITVKGYNLPAANQNSTLYWEILNTKAQFDTPNSGSFTLTYAGNAYGYSVGTFNVTANLDGITELTASANTLFVVAIKENSQANEQLVGLSENITIIDTFVPPPIPEFNYLVVAGGGGAYAAGGGGGGVLSGIITKSAAITYTISVGAGGGGGIPAASGRPGNSSNIIGTGANIWAYGGGFGYQTAGSPANAPANGGSGGGASISTAARGRGIYPGSPYISAARQGYDGGIGQDGVSVFTAGAGGGGGGGQGFTGAGRNGGDGGVAFFSTITGSNVSYAGGGAGGTNGPNATTPGSGVSGVGGASTNPALKGGGGDGGVPLGNNSTAGTTNTGGGGGGLGSPAGKAGGSGVVIISHPIAYPTVTATTGSPEVTTAAGNIVYRFTQSGSITI